jgi:replicative DNA helicase
MAIGKIELVGAPAILTDMISKTPTSAHGETYARLVQECYSKRQILELAGEIKVAVETEQPIERVLSQVQHHVDKTFDSVSKRLIMTMADRNHAQLDVVEKARKNGEVVTGIRTNIPGFDRKLGELFPGTYVIGARTHDGKTITLSTIAMNAVQQNKRVLFCNVADGSDETVLATFQGMECGLPPEMILRRTWNNSQYQTYLDMLSRTSNWNLFIKHKLQMNPRELWTEAKIISRTYGLDMIIVDYLQRMGLPDDVRPKDERQKMIYISAAMNEMVKEFRVPVVYGAQLLIMDENIERKNIIQDVDVAMTIWHETKTIPELTFNIEKNKINHAKGKFLAGFSNVTGKLVSNIPATTIDDKRKDVYQ